MSMRTSCLCLLTVLLFFCLPHAVKADKNDSLLQIINISTNQLEVLQAKIELSKLLS